MIHRRLAADSWQRVHRCVYRLAAAPITRHQQVLAACLAAGPDAAASHRSAGVLWGLPVPATVTELTIPSVRQARLEGVLIHRAVRLERRDVCLLEGIPVTGLARSVVDLAAVLTPPQLEIVLDHALSQRLVTTFQVRRCLERLGSRGRRGGGALSRLLAARPSGPNLESSFEWRLLRALGESGLPPPTPQHGVRLPNGRVARVDFAYPEARLAVEADSYRFHSSRSSWARDRARNNQLVALGWRVLPVTFDDLRDDPRGVAEQVARCLAST